MSPRQAISGCRESEVYVQYQWYPGHMAKTMRQMQEDLKLVDLIIEIGDARIPVSSRNPQLSALAQGKARILVFGKADLADPEENRRWSAFLEKSGTPAVFCDFRKNGLAKALAPSIRGATKKKTEREKRLGMRPRPVRAMVCGVPNAGKSTFINSFSGASSAKTGNKPGVTKGRQWVRMGKDVWLLDTAGVLWPKFENEETGKMLSLAGSMPDDIVNRTELALYFIETLKREYPGILAARYGISEEGDAVSLLQMIAAGRGALKKGGEADSDRAADLLLDDFRSGRLGRITLEKCY